MCLDYDVGVDEYVRRYIEITGYKIVRHKDNGDYSTAYMNEPTELNKELISDRGNQKLNRIDDFRSVPSTVQASPKDYSIRRGIHVFLYYDGALDEVNRLSRWLHYANPKIVRCRCKIKDLVAGGFFNGLASAAFMKVFINEVQANLQDARCC